MGDKYRVCSKECILKPEKGENMTGTRWVMEKWRGKGYFTSPFNCLIFGQTAVFPGKAKSNLFYKLGVPQVSVAGLLCSKATAAVPQKAPREEGSVSSQALRSKMGIKCCLWARVVFDAEVWERP